MTKYGSVTNKFYCSWLRHDNSIRCEPSFDVAAG